MNKDNKEIKDKSHYEIHNEERDKKEYKITTPSKLKCGKIGIDCLIKN